MQSSVTCFDMAYDLPRAALTPSRAQDPTALGEWHERHGANEFIREGDVAPTDEGLRLDALDETAWASPVLWSGVKNVTVAARVRLEELGDAPALGVKFGRVGAIQAEGPRVTIRPKANEVFFHGGESQRPAPTTAFQLPRSDAVEVEAEYSFDRRRVRLVVDGASALELPLPQDPFEDFISAFGRPAPLTGLGVFASDACVTLEHLAIRADAPQRRIAAIGDSNTQRHFWVQALERALGEPITNLGIGGDTARGCRQRFERDVLPLAPEICIIFAGTNDLGGRRDTDEIVADLIAMARTARADNIRPVVGEILARRGYDRVAATNVALREACAADDIDMLRWYEPTRDAASDEMMPGFAPDGTHPVRIGGEAMVRAIDLNIFKETP